MVGRDVSDVSPSQARRAARRRPRNRNAVKNVYRLRKKPTPIARRLGESWRPYRSVASWYLWRSLDNAPGDHQRTNPKLAVSVNRAK